VVVRSYNQFCALAKALDVVGDRWTLLVMRELLIRPHRYGELQESLPGIASNLLVARLRNLEENGVIAKSEDGHYAPTEWGEFLREPVVALVRWGARLMVTQAENDTFQIQWLAHPVEMIFGGIDPSRPPLVAEIRSSGGTITMKSSEGRVTVREGAADAPDLVMTGSPEAVIGLLSGRLDRRGAESLGASVLGDVGALAGLRRSDWLSGPEALAPV
jgi:DNA-binding HxlR family transcriptional regulator